MIKRFEFFSPDEFERCVPPCSIDDMSELFLRKLDTARYLANEPFVLNSAFRSSSWDKLKGRSGKGYHTLGRAVDIACFDSVSRAKILYGCLSVGLSCGISDTFIHVDNRDNQIVFLY